MADHKKNYLFSLICCVIMDRLVLFMLLVAFVAGVWSQNATMGNMTAPAPAGAPVAATPTTSTTTTTSFNNKAGVIAAFGKAFLDIPLGFIQACRDSAIAVERAMNSFFTGWFRR